MLDINQVRRAFVLKHRCKYLETLRRFHMAVTTSQVVSLYVATFNRAPDAAGLAYWVNDSFGGNATVEQIALSFFDSTEAQAIYTTTMTTTERVTLAYHNLFNRVPDADGLAYWVEQLSTGAISQSNMLIAIINGAQGADVTIMANKTIVGGAFAAAGLNDVALATSIMATVTADAATVTAANTVIDNIVASVGSTFDLTTNNDTIVGTAFNDTFNGTYNAGIATDTFGFGGPDTINGGLGIDTLNISHLIDVDITPPDTLWTNISNIEKVVLNTTGNGAQTITTGANFDTAFATGVDFRTTTSGSGAITIDMATSAFTHAATLTTGSIAGAQTITTGSGAATVNATSEAGALTIMGVGLTAVTALTTGAGAQTIGDGGGNGVNLVTVNATSASGAQTITSTSTSNVTVTATSSSGLQTITTGAGNDTVTATAAAGTTNTIATGAGNDTIIASLGTDLITGGVGADTMTGGGAVDTFAFSAEGSLIGTSMDIITDFNTAVADILTFGGSTSVLAADATATAAGTNVQTSAGGLITFDTADNALALKIIAVQADSELDAAGSVALFTDGANTYVYYAGTAIGNSDDQLIQLNGITTLATITGGGTTTIA